MQRSHTQVGLSKVAVLALLAVAVLTLAGELGVSRERPRIAADQVNPIAVPIADGTNVFVGFDGIPGESTEKDHAGWCEALSFNMGMTLPNAAGAASVGSANMEDVVVTKVLDKASPKLAQYASQGTHLKNARIHITRASSGGGKTYYACELQDVLVTGYHVNASNDRVPVEELTLNYRNISATYTEYDGAGAVKGTTTFSYSRR
ncbi:MAG: Hcp family type VI secretion system effector [Solirubrobacterales bacterium]